MKRNKKRSTVAKVAAASPETAVNVVAPAKSTKAKKVETPAPVAEVPATKKKKKVAEVKPDKANAATVAAKITAEKELKYIYPENCQEEEGADKVELLERRKQFRARVRRTLASFNKRLGTLAKSKLAEDFDLSKKIIAEMEAFKKEVLVNPASV